ncbi:hypothetical protein HAX54_045046 [Datura stramonium]|uniref:Uncharacterized protein n=1 Tax=Datura stramonium TaxID=4076 RepID=A0ABS8WJA2_DATST|nr:hypothetical protein [Datura stramonium]
MAGMTRGRAKKTANFGYKKLTSSKSQIDKNKEVQANMRDGPAEDLKLWQTLPRSSSVPRSQLDLEWSLIELNSPNAVNLASAVKPVDDQAKTTSG